MSTTIELATILAVSVLVFALSEILFKNHRLSRLETAVLKAMGDTEHYGLDLVKRVPGIHRGNVYVVLARLVDRRLVTWRLGPTPRSSTEISPRRRRLYRATRKTTTEPDQHLAES